MSSDSYEKLYKDIEKRLARKKHTDLLRAVIESLREEGEEGVRREIKERVIAIKEE